MTVRHVIITITAVTTAICAPLALEGALTQSRRPSARSLGHVREARDDRGPESGSRDSRPTDWPPACGKQHAPIRGIVRDDAGGAVAVATVYLVDRRVWAVPRAVLESLNALCRVDGRGAFLLTPDQGVRLDNADLIIAASGYRPYVRLAGTWNPDCVQVVQIERGVSVAGSVVDHNGKSVRGAAVRAAARSIDELAWLDEGFPGRYALDAKETVTDESGRFVLDGLVPTRLYRVQAEKQGYVPGTDPVRALAAIHADDLAIPAPCSDLLLVLEPIRAAVVRVRHDDHDHTAYAAPYIGGQHVQLPVGLTYLPVDSANENPWLPRYLRAELSRIKEARAGRVSLLAGVGESTESYARLRWRSIGSFSVVSSGEIELRAVTELEWARPQTIELSAARGVRLGQLHLVRTGRRVWARPCESVWLSREDSTPRDVPLIFDLAPNEGGLALVTPPIPVGRYVVRVLGYVPVATDVATVTVTVTDVRVAIFAADGELERGSLELSAAYASGLPASHLELIIASKDKVILRRPWPMAFRDGHDRLPLSLIRGSQPLEVHVWKPGFPPVTQVIRGLPAGGRIALEFPGLP